MLEQIKVRDLKDLNYAAKKQIIKGLEEQKDTEACYSLIGFLYEEHKPIQKLAMNALINMGSTDVVQGVLPLLHENGAATRDMAFEIIRETGYDKIFLLIPLLESPYESVRICVADLLGLIGNVGVVEPLIASLQDTSAKVRSSALASLGRLGDERAIEPINHLLQTDEQLWVIFSCIKSLEKIGGRKAMQILLGLLKQENEFILAATIESLGEVASVSIIPYMLQTIANPTKNIIERMNTAFTSILKREQPADLSKPIAHLPKQSQANLISFFRLCAESDINIWVRLRSIELLAKFKARESLAILAQNAQNSHSVFRLALAKALQRLDEDNRDDSDTQKLEAMATKKDD